MKSFFQKIITTNKYVDLALLKHYNPIKHKNIDIYLPFKRKMDYRYPVSIILDSIPEKTFIQDNIKITLNSDKLPNNFYVLPNTTLHINNSKIIELPENLVIRGSLDISKSKYFYKINNVYINGNLDVSNTNLNEIAPNTTINGMLKITNTPISRKYTINTLKKMYPNINFFVK
jgi:hypothetical protein